MKMSVLNDLQNLKHVSITTDAWSSQVTTSYLTITVSGIDEKWNIHTKVLQTREFKQPHTGENLKNIIR